MKIVFFATYYPSYIKSFLGRTADFNTLSYEQQMQRIRGDYFGVFGSYVNYANRDGNESHLIIANCEPMQKQWAKENAVKYDEKNWMHEIPIEQIKKIKPDIFFIGSMFEYYGSFLDEIKPYCKKIFGWIACPIPPGIKLNQLSLILTSLPTYVADFRTQGINSELLPAAFDADILKSLPKNVKQDIDFSFIGGIGNAHGKRVQLLQEMAKHTSVKLFGYGFRDRYSWKARLRNIIYPNTIESRYQGEAWGLEMYRTLQRSKITFNAHIDVVLGNRVNMRMYEATGVGTLLLTDKSEKSEVEYFADGAEIITYASAGEAIEKARYYLKNEEERLRIAKAGQQRTLSQYNFETNMKMMLSYFKRYS
jgi:spore maturation protein CgeB